MKRYFRGIRKPNIPIGLRRFLLALLAAAFLLLLVRGCWLTQVEIDSTCAMPGVLPGDRVLMNRTAYGLRLPIATRDGARHIRPRAPQRGEWCVAEYPAGSGNLCVQQITALPGDTLTDPEMPDRRYVLPPATYAAGRTILRHADLVGRPVCVTYSIDAAAPWLHGWRADRFMTRLP